MPPSPSQASATGTSTEKEARPRQCLKGTSEIEVASGCSSRSHAFARRTPRAAPVATKGSLNTLSRPCGSSLCTGHPLVALPILPHPAPSLAESSDIPSPCPPRKTSRPDAGTAEVRAGATPLNSATGFRELGSPHTLLGIVSTQAACEQRPHVSSDHASSAASRPIQSGRAAPARMQQTLSCCM